MGIVLTTQVVERKAREIAERYVDASSDPGARDVLVALIVEAFAGAPSTSPAHEPTKDLDAVRAEEREACAVMCTAISDAFADSCDTGQALGASQCADQIRATLAALAARL